MVEQVRAEGVEPLVVESGLSLQPLRPVLGAGADQQLKDKAALILHALADADAIALGAQDWALGPAWVRAQVDTEGAPLVAANLTCSGAAPYPAYRSFLRSGRRVVVLGVTDGEIDGCEVSDPAPALSSALASALQEGPIDAVIALVPLSSASAVSAAVGDAQGITVVLDAQGRYGAAGPQRLGEAWALGAGTRGKHVGRLDLVFVPDGSGWFPVGADAAAERTVRSLRGRIDKLVPRIAAEPLDTRRAALEAQRHRLEKELAEAEAALAPPSGGPKKNEIRASEVALSRDVADHEATALAVASMKAGLARAVEVSALARSVPGTTSPYAGSDTCTSCHAEPARQWGETPHATAYATLAQSGDAADASCVPCHVTGHGAEGGVTGPSDVGALRDVQCESCHGPGRAHVMAPSDPALRPVAAPAESVCQQCHDNERDEGRFDFAAYLPKVVHGTTTDP